MVEVTAPWKDSDATPERREAAGLRDERLIPAIVELVAAPRLAKIASTSWDPVSTTQTRRLLDAFHHIREFEVSEAALEVRTGSAPCHMCRAVLTSGCIVAQAVLEGVLKRLQGAAENLCVPLVERANGELAPVTLRQYQLSLKVSGAAAALGVH